MPQGTRSPVWRYGVSIFVTIAAVLLTTATPLVTGARVPFSLLLVAILIGTWYGGLGPGLAATALTALAGLDIVERPLGSLTLIEQDSVARFGLFLASAVIVIAIAAERDGAQRIAQTQARHQAALAELGQRALQSNSLQQVKDQVPTLVAQTLGVECSYVAENRPDGGGFLLIAGVGWKDGTVGRARLAGSDDCQAGYTLLTQEPVVSTDLRKEKRFSPSQLLFDHGLVSGMTVVIFGSEKPFGILGAFTTRRRIFSADDTRFLQGTANILAAAIQREHAQDELRRLNTDLEQRVGERTAQMETANAGLRREIAERKQMEGQVQRLYRDLERRAVELEIANKELESFSYSVSHDLRTPLASIDGFTRILLDDYAAQFPPEAQRYVGLIRSGSQEMERLVTSLLGLSRVGRTALNKEHVKMTALARETLETLPTEVQRTDVTVDLQDLPDAEADPVLLKQVWVNLLANAFKFTRNCDNTRIEIGCAPCDGADRVYHVRDNGVGFDMNQAERLFGVFQRLHAEGDYEGTGVGLAIVSRIITRHGGRVWAEAEVGKGATFYFTLPT